MKKHIPNTLTLLNLFSGCVAAMFVWRGDFDFAFCCLVLCGVFDFLDGASARLLKVPSPIGKDLDSLADMISFGFVPGLVMYKLLSFDSSSEWLPFFGFVITVFSALRLAKFNVDERQSTDFVGVNTPMNTFLVISLPAWLATFPTALRNEWFLIGFTLLSSFMLVSNLRLFSMKPSDTSWANNKYRYIFLAVSIVFFVLLKDFGIPLIFLSYIVFSRLHFSSIR